MENNFFVLAVVFAPLIGAVVALLVKDDLTSRWIGFGSSVLSALASIYVLVMNLNVGPQLYRMGGFEPPYGIVFTVDLLSAFFGLMAAVVMSLAFLYTVTCNDKAVKQRSFVSMFLCMQTGLIGAFYTGDIFTLFVFMELMVLSSVGLTAISDNKLGLEAAMKYIFISGMGTLFLLLGIAAMYASFGSLNMADIAQQLGTDERPFLAVASEIMLLCAFLLKGAVFPFHFWQPDFHTTAPTPVSAVLSSVVVKIGIYGVIRMETLLFVAEANIIGNVVLILGIISIFFGGLAALATYNGKRMLAYSTFGQIGFILLGIGWGTPLALAAALVYAFNHAFIKSALLMLFGVVASRTKEKTAALVDTVGVGKSLPGYVGLVYLAGGLALAGLPPMNGFMSKFALMRSGVDTSSWWLVGLAIGGGLITSMYMIRTWQSVFQRYPGETTAKLKDEGMYDKPYAPAILIGACLVLGLFAQPLFDVAERTVEQISDPQIYISATNPQTASASLEIVEGE
ncbi:MAG: proton-conducting transporter membrane subunit [Chloroflexota bacterium]